MANQQPARYVFDTIKRYRGTALYEVLIGGVPVTEYQYDDNTKTVTLTERTASTTATRREFTSFLLQVNEWLKRIRETFDIDIDALVYEFKMSMEKNTSSVEFKLKINGDEVSKLEYSLRSQEIEASKRDEVTLEMSEFAMLLRMLRIFRDQLNGL